MSHRHEPIGIRFPPIHFGVIIASLTLCLTSLPVGSRIVKAADKPPIVTLLRTPNDGIQPQAQLDAEGILHLIYFRGAAGNGDIHYVSKPVDAPAFSPPIQVNSQPGSAIAVGTIRGAQLALGVNGRVHVAWNGSSRAEPKGPMNATPMLYARRADSGLEFELQRNVIKTAYGLDGGGAVAADLVGNVYVAWHGSPNRSGEANRKVYVVRSSDEGRTFTTEAAATSIATGACGCCGMKGLVDPQGNVFMLYRSARENVNRDMYLLVSTDQGKKFKPFPLDRWQVARCPMSSESLAASAAGVFGAWETEGQVFFSPLASDGKKPNRPASAPGAARNRKHPAIAANSRGEVLLVWTEGTAWEKGGTLAWQIFDSKGKPTKDKGTALGVPVWGLLTAVTRPDDGFVVIY